MAYEPRDNSGSLFSNDRKEQPNHPDRQGTAMIGGVEYWVKGWLKSGSKGQWLSLAFTPKDGAKAAPRQEQRRPEPTGGPDFSDEIPFAPEWR